MPKPRIWEEVLETYINNHTKQMIEEFSSRIKEEFPDVISKPYQNHLASYIETEEGEKKFSVLVASKEHFNIVISLPLGYEDDRLRDRTKSFFQERDRQEKAFLDIKDSKTIQEALDFFRIAHDDLVKLYGGDPRPQANPAARKNYFIFKTKEGSVYEKDAEGKTYHYVMGIPGSRQIHEGDFFVYYRLGEKVFFGAGHVSEIEQHEVDDKTECLARISRYHEFLNAFDASEIDITITQPGIQRIGRDIFETIALRGFGFSENVFGAISKYIEWRERQQWIESGKKTSRVLKKLLDAVLDTPKLEPSDFDTVYLMTIWQRGISADKKKERLGQLQIDEDVKNEIAPLIDEGVGCWGTGMHAPSTNLGETGLEAVRILLTNFRDADTKAVMLQVLEEFIQKNVGGAQAGVLSNLLYCLKPTDFPVINNGIKEGADKWMNLDVSTALSEYSGEMELILALRDFSDLGDDLRDVDAFLYGKWEEETVAFDGFTEEDFRRCTGRADDAKYLREHFLKFQDALIPEFEAKLGDFVWGKGRGGSPYVAQWFKRGARGVVPRDHMWLGMSHRRYDNPRDGVQYQFGVGKHGLFAMGLWVDSRTALRERERISNLIREEPENFLRLIKPLLSDFKIGVGKNDGQRTFYQVGDSLEEFAEMVEDRNTHFLVIRDLSKEEVISMASGIISETAESFERLLPLHDFLLGHAGSVVDRFHSYVRSQGFNFSRDILANYYLALKTKPFVILTGISGTGKTKLAQLFGEFMAGADECDKAAKRHAFISVRPDWTDSKGLLGFYNAIREKYEPTETLKLLLRAHDNYWKPIELSPGNRNFRTDSGEKFPEGTVGRVRIYRQESGVIEDRVTKLVFGNGTASLEGIDPSSIGTGDKVTAFLPNRDADPYFVILDEMNLAKVEHYFSDFLSALESRRIRDRVLCQEPVMLHDQPKDESFMDVDGQKHSIPPRLEVPPNVYFTGTVNIDETTYMFSPKVLDRANTIEFTDVDLEHYHTILQERGEESGTGLAPLLATAEDFQSFTSRGRFVEKLIGKDFDVDEAHYSELIQLSSLLQPYNLHFGYRVVDEILCYLDNAKQEGIMGTDSMNTAFDLQILQKILPKFHGSRNQLERPLVKLLRFCLDGMIFTNEQTADILSQQLEESIKIAGESVTYGPVGSDTEAVPLQARYPRSCKKLLRMIVELREQGFVSFIE